MTTAQVIGRFAPSPTGPLHFGSLIAAVGSYCLARQSGGKWLMRMEDLDPPRVVPGSADEILFAMESLGLHWDGEIIWQSQRQETYMAALERLREKRLVFDCACTRKEILLSAPHPGEEGPVYPGTCRSGLQGRKPRALRVMVSDEQVCFTDGVFGKQEQVLTEAVGDFVLRRADGLFAYQLAVVVDDAEAGVNQVVRGADLLSSTPRQIYLHSCLGSSIPRYIHLPLLVDRNGEKISKRNGAVTSITKENGGAVMIKTLKLLGQSVPDEFNRASASEILAWAVSNFSVKSIPSATKGLLLGEIP